MDFGRNWLRGHVSCSSFIRETHLTWQMNTTTEAEAVMCKLGQMPLHLFWGKVLRDL